MVKPKTQFIEASFDGTKLAYRNYQAHSYCQAILGFYFPLNFNFFLFLFIFFKLTNE